MSDPRIDNFAKGWVAEGVRYEPVERLAKRLRASALVTFSFLALLIASLVWGFGSWAKFEIIRLDFLFGLLTLVMGIAALQMWRFIQLRKSIAAEAS